MPIEFSIDRILTLPCLEAFRLYRSYQEKYPEYSTSEVLNIIFTTESDANNLDFDAAEFMSLKILRDCPLTGEEFYQKCISEILRFFEPNWIKLIKNGRIRFLKQIDANVRDVFLAAGIMEEPLAREVIFWWDRLSDFSRQAGNLKRLERGREAELLSLLQEKERVAKLGIDKIPEWLGLDDNFAGYDIHSYDIDKNNEKEINLLIEVKSSILSPSRFIISSNEWEKAEKSPDSYIFHVWDMSKEKPILHTISVADVSPHIPSNNGNGSWKNAEIPLG